MQHSFNLSAYGEMIPPQETYFYTGLWDEKAVKSFVDILLNEKQNGSWKTTGENIEALNHAQNIMKNMLGKMYFWDDVLSQRNLLMKRFQTFKNILETEDVRWDKRYNYVYACTTTWVKLAKDDDFAKAFYHKGDVMYENLSSLFDPKEELPCDVILISSGDPTNNKPNTAFNPITITDSDDETEVVSPYFCGPKKRLFSELEASNASGPPSVESNVEGVPVNPSSAAKLKGTFQRLKKDNSSCASNSPVKCPFSAV